MLSPYTYWIFPQRIAHICVISRQLLSDIFPLPFYNDSYIYLNYRFPIGVVLSQITCHHPKQLAAYEQQYNHQRRKNS